MNLPKSRLSVSAVSTATADEDSDDEVPPLGDLPTKDADDGWEQVK